MLLGAWCVVLSTAAKVKERKKAQGFATDRDNVHFDLH